MRRRFVFLSLLLSVFVFMPAYAAEYRTYDQVRDSLSALARAHPGIARYVPSIGTSVEGRAIPAIKIGKDPQSDDPGKSDVLFVGGQHAREWIGIEVPLRFAEHLVNSYATNAQVKALIDSKEIWIIPMANPDGYVHSRTTFRLWRKNRHNFGSGVFGVDLNRNYGYLWGSIDDSYNSHRKVDDTYIGERAFSEPESGAVRDFIEGRSRTDNPITRLIDYHSYGQKVLYPWGHTSDPAPDKALLKQVADEIASRINQVAGGGQYASEQAIGLYATAGDITDWAYGEKGILAFTIELRPKDDNPGFELPANQIDAAVAENLPGALWFIGFDRGRSMDFEGSPDAVAIRSSIAGMSFTTTAGYDWIYGDERNPNYNAQAAPDPSGPYASNGHGFAWLGPNQGQGRIDFTDPGQKTVGLSFSAYSQLYLEAYDSKNALIQTSSAGGNLRTGRLDKLSVSGPISYVLVHDTGNYWLIDDLFVTDGLAEAQALVPGKFARKLELIENFQLGQSRSFSFFGRKGENTKVVVQWPGSTFRVQLIDPSGNVAMEMERDAPPIVIDQTVDITGDWRINVTAVEVSGPEPMSLVVGAFDPDDTDADGIPNGQDNCPNSKNANQADGDFDGVGDACDNCPRLANANQADRYPTDGPEGPGNGIGDACEVVGDLNADGAVDKSDIDILQRDLNKPVSASACGFKCDLDGDKRITALDARKLTLLCTRPRCATQ